MGRIKVTKPASAQTSASVQAGRSNLIPWKPGESGNFKGRYMGSRQKLSEKFINDLSDFYEVEGASLIKRLADENPTALIQVIARLLPKETNIQITAGTPLSLTLEQRERIAESWLMSQVADDAIEGTAVRIESPQKLKSRDSQGEL